MHRRRHDELIGAERRIRIGERRDLRAAHRRARAALHRHARAWERHVERARPAERLRADARCVEVVREVRRQIHACGRIRHDHVVDQDMATRVNITGVGRIVRCAHNAEADRSVVVDLRADAVEVVQRTAVRHRERERVRGVKGVERIVAVRRRIAHERRQLHRLPVRIREVVRHGVPAGRDRVALRVFLGDRRRNDRLDLVVRRQFVVRRAVAVDAVRGDLNLDVVVLARAFRPAVDGVEVKGADAVRVAGRVDGRPNDVAHDEMRRFRRRARFPVRA